VIKHILRLGALLCLLCLLCLPLPAVGETFLAVADLHLSGDGQGRRTAAEAVAAAAADADCVLVLGDSANNGRDGEHRLAMDFARLITERSGAPVLFIPGNHDYTRTLLSGDFALAYGAFGPDDAFSRDAATASFALFKGETCLIMLDTNGFDGAGNVLPDGGIASETLSWVRAVLDGLAPGTPVVACGHHPILPAARDARTPGASALADILRAYAVPIYLCGHDHGFHTVSEGGLTQVTVGQPHAYPGWAGLLTVGRDGDRFEACSLYPDSSDYFTALRSQAQDLARRMGEGTLRGTLYEGDPGAVDWFSGAFFEYLSGTLTQDKCRALLANENCAKWRQIETRTVVRDWIIGLLEDPPQDVRLVLFHTRRDKMEAQPWP